MLIKRAHDRLFTAEQKDKKYFFSNCRGIDVKTLRSKLCQIYPFMRKSHFNPFALRTAKLCGVLDVLNAKGLRVSSCALEQNLFCKTERN